MVQILARQQMPSVGVKDDAGGKSKGGKTVKHLAHRVDLRGVAFPIHDIGPVDDDPSRRGGTAGFDTQKGSEKQDQPGKGTESRQRGKIGPPRH